MTCKTRILYLLIVLFAGLRMNAQFDAQFTQYYVTPAFYNPAAAGNIDFLDIKAGAKLQWVGIDGAPKTFFLGASMPFMLFGKQKFGPGVQIYQESIGLYKTLMAAAQISYKLKLFNGTFSIGIQPGFISQTFKGSQIYIPQEEDSEPAVDEDLPSRDISGSTFDLGAGIWYSRTRWWIGFSVSHITSPTVTFKSENQDNTTSVDGKTSYFEFSTLPCFYLMSGCNIPIKNTLFEINPSVLLKHTGSYTTAEATAIAGWKKMFYAGLSYRWDEAVSIILAAEIKGVYLGYSYDYPTTAISRASKGSHELVAGYRLKIDLDKNNRHKYKSIRLM